MMYLIRFVFKCQVFYHKKMDTELRDNIKILLLKNHMTMTVLASEMSKVLKKNISQNNLSQKLGNSSIRYDELQAICKILGYRIKLEEK